jgi:ABC-2 type transport system permease protein
VKPTTGTLRLVRLILRRDRLLIPLWVSLSALLPIAFAGSISTLYPTAESRRQLATAVGSSPPLLALLGPIYDPGIGGITSWRMGIIPVLVGIFTLLSVIRHTRTEEEAGRRELLGSTVIGRQAGLAAALVASLAASLVLGILLALGMAAQSGSLAGSVAFGLGYVAAGWIFALVGAVAGQLTETSGAARGIAISTLAGSYLVRVAADATGVSWLTWASPFGWVQQVRPYAGERWWSLLPALGLVIPLAWIAFALSARRDLGAGLLASAQGPAAGSVRTPLGLAWRLHRGTVIAWTMGSAAMGVVLGGLVEGMNDLMPSQMREAFIRLVGQGSLTDAVITGFMWVFALTAAGQSIQAALRMRTEEEGLRVEPVLATATGRLRWMGSHLIYAILGPAAMMAVAGLATGVVHGLNSGDLAGQLPRVLAGAAVQLPAVWVTGGIAVALFGLLPGWSRATWGALVAFFLLGQLGSILQLDQWALDLSPFTHVPRVPGGEFALLPMAWLLLAAALLVSAGLLGFRRRDLG